MKPHPTHRILKLLLPIVPVLLFLSCNNKIVTGDKLSRSDTDLIKSINLLDQDETIIKFYSTHKNSVSGNFFTKKRLASYWLDKHHKEKTSINTAYYEDIMGIDPIRYAGATYSSYIKVIKSDSTEFKVYIDGDTTEMRSFYNDILSLWEENKKQK